MMVEGGIILRLAKRLVFPRTQYARLN